MIRAVLAVMAGILTGVAGMRQARFLRQTAARLTRWEAVLHHLTLLLSEGASTLPEAFGQAAMTDAPPDKVLRELASSMRAAPLTSLPELVAAQALPSPERDVLTRWSARVCRGSLAARCQATEEARGELALLAASAQAKHDRDARMWTTLGWVGGACVALLLV